MPIICKWCLRKKAIKDGLLRGKQLYYCKNCGRKFTDTTRTNIYDRFIAWGLYNVCKDKWGNNEFTSTKLTANQIAKILSRSPQTVSMWIYKSKPKNVYEKELRKYLETRKNGVDILNLLGLGSENALISDFLWEIITRKPKPKKEITKKELERQERIARQEQEKAFKEQQRQLAINTPITSRKNAIEKLWTLLDCSQRLLFGLRYTDFENRKTGDTFEIQYAIVFAKGKIEAHKGFSIFDKGHPYLHISTTKILEIVEWLKVDTANNRQRLENDYDNSFLDFICVKDNGKFYYPHELKRAQMIL